ncbi:hypothetical protein [Cellulomonas hominis]
MTVAADLLSAVRGRRLCFELARRGEGGAAASRAMFDETWGVHERRGDIAHGNVAYVSSRPVVGRDDGQPIAPPTPDPTLVEALRAVDAAAVIRAEHLLPALSRTVATAKGWQPPDAEDVVLANPAVSAALLPIAEALCAVPGAQWWSAPLDRDAQVRTRFEPQVAADRPRGSAAERLRRWRTATLDAERDFARRHAEQPDGLLGGTWWVTPALVRLDLTTRTLADAGSAALWLTEDELGWQAAELVPCSVDPAARVLEIAGPADWAELVAAYPLDVTASRRPDWFGAVAARAGDWLIPDWSAVAEAYDGVHVSVLGWLTTSGVPVPVRPGATTTLAGWDPDATWWLADVLDQRGAGSRWVRGEESWRPDDGTE